MRVLKLGVLALMLAVGILMVLAIARMEPTIGCGYDARLPDACISRTVTPERAPGVQAIRGKTPEIKLEGTPQANCSSRPCDVPTP